LALDAKVQNCEARRIWHGEFWRRQREDEDDGRGGSTPIFAVVIIWGPTTDARCEFLATTDLLQRLFAANFARRSR
jgi:hypothetical protein